MKKTLLFCFCAISFSVFSQNSLSSLTTPPDKNPNRIMTQANELLKKQNKQNEELTIEQWEQVLKEIGNVTKSENVLFCQKSKVNHATLTFEDGKLISVCETYETEDYLPKTKKNKHRE